MSRCKKHRHANKWEAESHIRSLIKSGKGVGLAWLNAYKCPKCGKWHVGRRIFGRSLFRKP